MIKMNSEGYNVVLVYMLVRTYMYIVLYIFVSNAFLPRRFITYLLLILICT